MVRVLSILLTVGLIFLALYLLVSIVGRAIQAQKQREAARRDHEDLDDGDKAMVVSFITSRGPSTAYEILTGMLDFTKGTHDWTLEKTLRHVYRLLDRLENVGVLTSAADPSGRRYSLVRQSSINVEDI